MKYTVLYTILKIFFPSGKELDNILFLFSSGEQGVKECGTGIFYIEHI